MIARFINSAASLEIVQQHKTGGCVRPARASHSTMPTTTEVGLNFWKVRSGTKLADPN
jgi:hypothetical protein